MVLKLVVVRLREHYKPLHCMLKIGILNYISIKLIFKKCEVPFIKHSVNNGLLSSPGAGHCASSGSALVSKPDAVSFCPLRSRFTGGDDKAHRFECLIANGKCAEEKNTA